MSEEELIYNLRRNDNAAFRVVYKNTYPMVSKYIKENNGNQEDAEDIFQEAVIALIKKLHMPEFQLSSKLSTFLFSIAKNMWLYRLRSKKNNTTGLDGIELIDDGLEELIQKEERDHKLEKIAESLKELKEDCRRILIDFYYLRKPLIELASELGYTEKFIRVKKSRCMQTFSEIVNNHNL